MTPVAAIPAATPAVVLTPAVAATPEATKAMTKPLLSTLLGSHTEFAETPKAHPVVTIVEATPEATPAATKAADHAVLNAILADKTATQVPIAVVEVIPEATPAATKAADHPVLDSILADKTATPVATPAVVLVPVATPVTTPVATPEETVPAVAVSGRALCKYFRRAMTDPASQQQYCSTIFTNCCQHSTVIRLAITAHAWLNAAQHLCFVSKVLVAFMHESWHP